jgi:hypothetical protein
MNELLIIAALIGIAAFTISCLLMAQGEILAPWALLISKAPRWMAKPLGACEKCLAGQAALWLFPFWFTDGTYDAVIHVLFTTTAIFTAAMATATYSRITGNRPTEHRPWVKIPDELKTNKHE